jgi:hypothetical protein
MTDEHKQKIRDGIKKYWENRDPNEPTNWTGRKQSEEHIAKRMESRGMNYNEPKHPAWDEKRRDGQIWSKNVKVRDNYCCVYCGATENLHSHHILTKHKHPEFALFINNGITLCHTCHWDEHRMNGYI